MIISCVVTCPMKLNFKSEGQLNICYNTHISTTVFPELILKAESIECMFRWVMSCVIYLSVIPFKNEEEGWTSFLAPTRELYELLCHRGRLLGLLLLERRRKNHVLLGNWILFIRFWQKLAWTCSLTIKTSPRKDFWFFSKFSHFIWVKIGVLRLNTYSRGVRVFA